MHKLIIFVTSKRIDDIWWKSYWHRGWYNQFKSNYLLPIYTTHDNFSRFSWVKLSVTPNKLRTIW